MFHTKKILVLITFAVLACFGWGAAELIAAEKKYIILIDPAHGGKDRGLKLNDDVSEEDVTLAVALQIKKELAQEPNLQIILTRETDKTLDREARQKMIKTLNPDMVLNLHVNGGFGKEASGYEIYYPSCGADDPASMRKTDKTKPQSQCQNNSLKMAKLISDNFNALFPRKARGLRMADLSVTEGVLVPAVAVEMGFATNAVDQKNLMSKKTQAEIGKALAVSIKAFSR